MAGAALAPAGPLLVWERWPDSGGRERGSDGCRVASAATEVTVSSGVRAGRGVHARLWGAGGPLPAPPIGGFLSRSLCRPRSPVPQSESPRGTRGWPRAGVRIGPPACPAAFATEFLPASGSRWLLRDRPTTSAQVQVAAVTGRSQGALQSPPQARGRGRQRQRSKRVQGA